MAMTPKEKAIELVNNFTTFVHQGGEIDESEEDRILDNAKDCALIVVDEILNQDKGVFDITEAEYHFSYWSNVKEELENLK